MPTLQAQGKRNLAEGLDVQPSDRAKEVAKDGKVPRSKGGRMRRRRNEHADLEVRLEDWGVWLLTPIKGISYRDRTMEADMMEYGCIVSGGGRGIVPDYQKSPRNAETDRAVKDMPEGWQRVVYARYVMRLKPAEIIEHLVCSRQHYDNELNQALAFLTGRLGFRYGA